MRKFKLGFFFILITYYFKAQVGIGTNFPTKTLDVAGDVRIRNLSQVWDSSTPLFLVSNLEGDLQLYDATKSFPLIPSNNSIINGNVTSPNLDEQTVDIYNGECYDVSNKTSGCSIEILHYSSCSGFTVETPIYTSIFLYPDIDTSGNFSGKTIIIGDHFMAAPIHDIVKISNKEKQYFGSTIIGGGQCYAKLKVTDLGNGNIKIQSTKKYMYSHVNLINTIIKY